MTEQGNPCRTSPINRILRTPNAHTEQELKWICDYHRRNPNISVCELYGKLREDKAYSDYVHFSKMSTKLIRRSRRLKSPAYNPPATARCQGRRRGRIDERGGKRESGRNLPQNAAWMRQSASTCVQILPFIKDNVRRTIVTERRETALKDIDKRMADT